MVMGGRTALADDWPGFSLSETRARLSAERSGPLFRGGQWAYRLPPVQDSIDHALIASPAIADGFVIIGTSDARIRALRERDGRAVWAFPVGDALHASPAIHAGLVYAASLDRNLYALRIDTGELIWQRDLGGIVYSSPVIAAGRLFIAAGNPSPRLFRLNPADGGVDWVAGEGILQQAVHGSVAVAEGHVLVGEMEGRVHSFAAATGAHEWTYHTGGTLNLGSPLVIDGRAYLLPGGEEKRLFAIDLATGGSVPGWPIDIEVPDDVLAGNRVARTRVVSSPEETGDRGDGGIGLRAATGARPPSVAAAVRAALALTVAAVAACGGKDDGGPPLATPTVDPQQDAGVARQPARSDLQVRGRARRDLRPRLPRLRPLRERRRRADVDRRSRSAPADADVEGRGDDRVHADRVRAELSVQRPRLGGARPVRAEDERAR